MIIYHTSRAKITLTEYEPAIWKNEEEWLAKGTSGGLWIAGKWYVGHCDWCNGKTKYPDISGAHLVNEAIAYKWSNDLEDWDWKKHT